MDEFGTSPHLQRQGYPTPYFAETTMPNDAVVEFTDGSPLEELIIELHNVCLSLYSDDIDPGDIVMMVALYQNACTVEEWRTVVRQIARDSFDHTDTLSALWVLIHGVKDELLPDLVYHAVLAAAQFDRDKEINGGLVEMMGGNFMASNLEKYNQGVRQSCNDAAIYLMVGMMDSGLINLRHDLVKAWSELNEDGVTKFFANALERNALAAWVLAGWISSATDDIADRACHALTNLLASEDKPIGAYGYSPSSTPEEKPTRVFSMSVAELRELILADLPEDTPTHRVTLLQRALGVAP